jgi:hypothetical protein
MTVARKLHLLRTLNPRVVTKAVAEMAKRAADVVEVADTIDSGRATPEHFRLLADTLVLFKATES